MSKDVHATCTGTVQSTWVPVTPPTGKAHHEFKIKLDDSYYGEKRFAGRGVNVKSYDRSDFLTPIQPGERVFVAGTVQAVGYLSKKTGQPGGAMVIYAKTVAIDGSPPHTDGTPGEAGVAAAADPASARAAKPSAATDDEEALPF